MTTQAASAPDGVAPELKLQPIDVLTTNAARSYHHVHTALILSILYASFSAIVEDPVTSLSYLLVPFALLQAAFCCICVPPSSKPSNPTQQPASSGKSSQQQRKRPKAQTWQADLNSRLIPAVVSTILSFLLTTPPLFILAILHGAPVTSHLPHTLLLATHLSLLSCIPLFYAHGVSSTRWRMLYSLQAPVDELMGAAMGTMVGAWAGAVPIPLDWDREWQKWPVTVVAGAYVGWAVGRTLGGWNLAKGAYVKFD